MTCPKLPGWPDARQGKEEEPEPTHSQVIEPRYTQSQFDVWIVVYENTLS